MHVCLSPLYFFQLVKLTNALSVIQKKCASHVSFCSCVSSQFLWIFHVSKVCLATTHLLQSNLQCVSCKSVVGYEKLRNRKKNAKKKHIPIRLIINYCKVNESNIACHWQRRWQRRRKNETNAGIMLKKFRLLCWANMHLDVLSMDFAPFFPAHFINIIFCSMALCSVWIAHISCFEMGWLNLGISFFLCAIHSFRNHYLCILFFKLVRRVSHVFWLGFFFLLSDSMASQKSSTWQKCWNS